ncbi:MAG TPA: cold shock domain-containing protein [Terriglobales bacterium]|nr:cold shock domain-containing protein [Terriglobales bacterium]
MRGIVKEYDELRGFGSIAQEDYTEIFVHQTGIQGDGFRFLCPGDVVEYEIERGIRGPHAHNVRVVSRPTESRSRRWQARTNGQPHGTKRGKS